MIERLAKRRTGLAKIGGSDAKISPHTSLKYAAKPEASAPAAAKLDARKVTVMRKVAERRVE